MNWTQTNYERKTLPVPVQIDETFLQFPFGIRCIYEYASALFIAERRGDPPALRQAVIWRGRCGSG